ncbi:hypothetical protein PG990_012119 [Apiospora arundinis]
MTMAGYGVSMTFYLFAGALSAAHGFLNVVLWSTCILLMGAREQEELGLDRFMRTPKERTYGNMVWIQGGNGPSVGDGRGSVGGTVRRGSWAQRLFGRVGSVGGGGGGRGGGQTIWHSTMTAKVRPWGAGAAATDSSSKYSLNRHTTGPSEAGGGGTNNNNSSNETTEMQILTTCVLNPLHGGQDRLLPQLSDDLDTHGQAVHRRGIVVLGGVAAATDDILHDTMRQGRGRMRRGDQEVEASLVPPHKPCESVGLAPGHEHRVLVGALGVPISYQAGPVVGSVK